MRTFVVTYRTSKGQQATARVAAASAAIVVVPVATVAVSARVANKEG